MPKRNYGIDFLRILSMLMVVMLHVLGQGGVLANTEKFSGNYWIAWFLEIASYCAVNCFALTSGYVMCRSKPKISKITELWLQTAFYTILFTFIFFIALPETRGSAALLNAVFPITRRHYWYISAYFGLYLLIPLLNVIIEKTDKKTLELAFLSMFVAFSILPIILESDPYRMGKGYSLIWLCLLYLFGGYINKYDIINKIKKYQAWLLFASMIVITFLSKMGLEYLTMHLFGKPEHGNILINYISPTIVLAAIALFIACSKQTFPKTINKIISVFAPAALGVYLIHVCIPVWKNILKDFAVEFASQPAPIMILLVLAATLIIYFTCSLIELLRIQLFRLFKIKNLCIKLDDLIMKHFNKKEDAQEGTHI